MRRRAFPRGARPKGPMAVIEREYPSLRATLLAMLAVFAALFLALTVYLYLASRALFADALQRELAGDLEWLAGTLRGEPALLADPARADSLCKAISGYKGFRVTLIAADGRVLADSHVPRAELGTLENHASRPEVLMAASSGHGHSWRYSATLGRGMLYVAYKVPELGCYLRMAAGPVTLNAFQIAAMRVFLLFLALFLAASLAITWWISRKISAPLLHLVEAGGTAPDPLRPRSPTPRWEARFREAEVLNAAFRGYVDRIRSLGRDVERERDKLMAVLNQLDEGILILSADGAVAAANPSSLRLLGAPGSAQSWIGRPLREALPSGPLARWVSEAAAPDRPPAIHIDKGPDAPFDLLCHLAPLDPAAGGGEYLLTLLNVTEFRHLDRIKSEFVANASHELKTPLSSLKGYAEALVEGALEDPKVRLNFAKKIHANALRLERLVQDLLSLSRLEADEQPRESEPLPVRGYVSAAAGLHREALDAAGIRLENHVADDARVLAEARDLELILDNLVGNAVRYNKPGGKIKIWTEADDGGLKLSVKDTGIGIPPEMLPRIFERFYRADASRARKDGTGLGLAIVKHAAAKYGMTVSAESIVGEGSRFMVRIPAKLIAPA
jgi:two-component system phosphate regulon sensor histidine kinase PhoR